MVFPQDFLDGVVALMERHAEAVAYVSVQYQGRVVGRVAGCDPDAVLAYLTDLDVDPGTVRLLLMGGDGRAVATRQATIVESDTGVVLRVQGQIEEAVGVGSGPGSWPPPHVSAAEASTLARVLATVEAQSRTIALMAGRAVDQALASAAQEREARERAEARSQDSLKIAFEAIVQRKVLEAALEAGEGSDLTDLGREALAVLKEDILPLVPLIVEKHGQSKEKEERRARAPKCPV